MSLQKTPKNQLRAHFHWGENIAFSARVPFSVSCGSLWLFKLFFGPRSMVARLSVAAGFNRRVCLLQRIVKQIFFPTEAKVASRKQEFFDDQSKHLSCITARGTVSVPLQHGSGPLLQRAAPLRYRSGPLLQCAVPPQHRFGTARALCYNARRRLGTASVPLGPSITMRGADTPFAFHKVLIRSG